MAQSPADSSPLPLVGVGASAGGVEALQALFEALPEKVRAAFVVVVHLAPERPSELASILARKTRMPVQEVTDSLTLEAGQVYVIPPDRRLQLGDGKIGALPFDEPRRRRAPIDLFFRSLAEQHGDGLAVILSGSGSDGAVGVKAVKEQGGLILVQDPQEAAFDSMPRAAIATGAADFVLPVRELAGRLAQLLERKHHLLAEITEAERLEGEDQGGVRLILSHLHARTGHDFSQYKRPTVLRRLLRRMQVQRQETLQGYLHFLRENVEEAHALFDELLIPVTTFFRDPAAWQALAKQALPALFARRSETLRLWVPGCATGEEAYTLAILMLEESERHSPSAPFQIFASDLDEGALATAREGRYPDAIEADVSDARLRRYFEREDDHYRVTPELRDQVLFASHSLLRDPPFSRMDLISCRNLLIYLDREAQEKVQGILRYAMVPGGYLFLGASENAEGEYFRTLDKKYHIFQARELTGRLPPLLPDMISRPLAPPPAPPRGGAAKAEHSSLARAHQTMLEEGAPPSVLVDEAGSVLNLSNTAGRFLQPAGGPLTREVTALVRPELQIELSATLHHALDADAPSMSSFVPVRFNGAPRNVAVLVQPRPKREDRERLALVIFLDAGEAVPDTDPAGEDLLQGASGGRIRELQDELASTRARLRASREESEAVNEELRAANEELQSLNEEYRSTAEELETSKEELQSINEELQTVNNELKGKLEEVSRAHNDLENLVASTDVGTLFLDRYLRIQRFTPQVGELFRIRSSDRGRCITDLTHRLDYQRLQADARQVLRDLSPAEQELRRDDGRWFLMRMRPYRTMDDRIEGVIVSFVDITRQKHAEETLREADERKNQFLGLLGHELRNPLAAISNTADVLQADGLPPEQVSESLMLVARQVRHVLRLVDDLLNLTRISQGRIELKRAPIDVTDSITDALEQTRSQIETRGHELSLELPEGPLPADADRERVTQILANLLSNAAHYTEPGGRITVVAERIGDQILVQVRDTGIGLDAEQLQELFKPFGRLSPGHHPAGLGLGLALARQLAQLHDGSLEASSPGPGKGSRFTLHLPALTDTQLGEPRDLAAEPPAGLPVRRILLVEDERPVRTALAMLLEQLGQEVHTASSGAQALEVAREVRPELVILDIGLPDMDGQEVGRRLRQQHGTEAFGLVALSGYGPEEHGEEPDLFDRYLLKPATRDELREVIANS